MRCLVTLQADQEQTYTSAYHIKLQGLLYRVLSEAGYEFVHEERPFKFVVFSNIFPPRDMSDGEQRTWIVASPHEHLIERFSETIAGYNTVTVGEQRYTVERTTEFEITPDHHATLETGTPIVVRIPAQRCEEYGIDAEYDDVYWRLDHPTEAFTTELEQNLAAKYRRYYDREPPDPPYFTELTPRKEVAIPLHYDDDVVQTIGTTWEIEFDCLNRAEYRLLKLAYCAGLGELNTTGFGFINSVG